MHYIKTISGGLAFLAMAVTGYAEESPLPIDESLRDRAPFSASSAGAQSINRVVQDALNTFNVPGLAVAVVHKGEVVHLKGYGIREINQTGKVDTDTLFKIASNSKAFTVAALSILVDEGKLSWDTPVIDIIPEFKMHDAWLSEHLTVADLLTHRTGMKAGAGDLMLWPEPSLFTSVDVIYALRYFEVIKGFRSGYAYDNLLYIVAGELIPRLTGLSWHDYIDQKIMSRLGLKHCFAGALSPAAKKNVSAPHDVIEGELQVIERGRINDNISLMAAAGGIRCSAADMSQWMLVLLNNSLYSKTQAAEVFTPQVIRSVSMRDKARDNTHFKAYGLGWRLADVHGYKQVSHTGSLAGTRSYLTLVPELDLGVVVLTNGASDAVRRSVMYHIVRAYMGRDPVDWVQVFEDDIAKWQLEKLAAAKNDKNSFGQSGKQAPKKITARKTKRLMQAYLGRYQDPWFGEINISQQQSGFVFQSLKSPQLRGELRLVDKNLLTVHWFDRTLEADAYLRFQRNENQEIETLTMEAISEETDFSFDFPDLLFSPVFTPAD